jgi:hypothetical protein
MKAGCGKTARPVCAADGGQRKVLILVATHGGPTMFARISIMQALNRHVERVFNPSGTKTHWGRRKLARDR